MKIGIDIGGSHIGLGVVNDNAQIIVKMEEDIKATDNMETQIEEYVVKNIKKLLKQAGLDISQIEQIGIAVPGNVKGNKICNCNNLGLHEFDLVKNLRKYFNTNIQIRNDAKCAAMCEKKYGELKDFKDCVFLCMGTGIGCAVFLNNQLLKPEKSEGFEIGHMVIQKNGKQCSCGNLGCFESYCSMKNLKSEVMSKLELKQEIMTSDIIDLMEKEEVRQIVEEYVENLSIGISNIINIFEPQAICFGGSLVYIKDIIIPRLELQIKEKKLLFDKDNETKYIIAQYGNNAGIIGSVLN